MAELQAEIVQTKLRLAEKEKKLEQLIAVHRAQILKSLSSKDETERKLAQAIAAYWGVER